MDVTDWTPEEESNLGKQILKEIKPQHEWKDLTDGEIEELAKWADKNAAPWHIEFARAILAAAKEKNT
jgi:hypothetical protein